MAEAFAKGDLGGEAEVALEGGGVSVGGGDVAGLHGDQLLVGFEVVVLWQDTGTEEFLLEDVDEVDQVFGLATTYII